MLSSSPTAQSQSQILPPLKPTARCNNSCAIIKRYYTREGKLKFHTEQGVPCDFPPPSQVPPSSILDSAMYFIWFPPELRFYMKHWKPVLQ